MPSTAITGDLIVQGNAGGRGTLGLFRPARRASARQHGRRRRRLFAQQLPPHVLDRRSCRSWPATATELWIDLTGATTVQDVIDLRERHHVGTTTARRPSRPGSPPPATGSSWSTRARWRRATSRCEPPKAARPPTTRVCANGRRRRPTSNTGAGGSYSLTSEDRHTLEVDSVYNSLIRLRTALQSGDTGAIGEAIERIDVDLNRVDFRPRRDRLAAANARYRRKRGSKTRTCSSSRPCRTKSTSTWSKRSRT